MIEPADILAILAPAILGVGLALVAVLVEGRQLAIGLGLGAVTLFALVPTMAAAVLPPADLPSGTGFFRGMAYIAILAALMVASSVILVRSALAIRGAGGAGASTRVLGFSGGRPTAPAAQRPTADLPVSDLQRYLELATRNSQISLYLQDENLVYQWVLNPRLGLVSEELVGKSDYEVMPKESHALVIGHKKRAMETGATQTFETSVTTADETLWFRVDVAPVSGADGATAGVVCAVIDITRAKRLDMMRTDLSRRLAETLQRFNLALRSERIVVFSQDLDMRYTWANSDETQIGSVIGRTDSDIIPPEDLPAITAIKQRAIETRKPQSAEIGIGSGAERQWFDLHVEPNIQPDGKVSGITCASIDVTHRKSNEEHMRLVMRELTHRTKNLLAVVIAIARQTSVQSGDVKSFVTALIGRLRALSAAQDLIVADDWAGVAMDALIEAVLAQHTQRRAAAVTLSGPAIILSPEAAQNLGLAIHELAVNAARHGALSLPRGKVNIEWSLNDDEGGRQIDFVWTESGGPPVQEPERSGFGMMVIRRNLARAMGADVQLDFRPAGLVARLSLPHDDLAPRIRSTEEQLGSTYQVV